MPNIRRNTPLSLKLIFLQVSMITLILITTLGGVSVIVKANNKSTAMSKTVVITGANKGIGYETARQLAESGQFHVILTARQQDAGKLATEKINSAYPNTVTFLPLDISSQESVNKFVAEIAERNIQVDILINNAGVYFKNSTLEAGQLAKNTLDINLFGTILITEALLPNLSKAKEARIITVSSYMGQLEGNHALAKEQFFYSIIQGNKLLSIEEIKQQAEEYIQAAKNDKLDEQGWPKNPYRVSKILLNQYNRVLATLVPNNILVAATHPGWVKSDMGGPSAARELSQGAEVEVFLCKVPTFKTGLFWMDNKEYAY